MNTTIIIFGFFCAWYLLIITALLFAISGMDDLFFDVFYWTRYYIRKYTTRNYNSLSYETLKSTPQKNIAVLLPCWHEAGVIGTMLARNCTVIEYQNYDIFVGVYPNDPDTIAAVQATHQVFPQVQCVIGATPGPTNKASNLNQIYQAVLAHEKQHHKTYDIFVFHDSEDIIHPLSFMLYNYLIPRKDMIQIPIFPLEVSYFNFTHWVYNDEFCENHTKDIIVREAIKGLVPSAGVGTAFSRRALATLGAENQGMPFATYSLTEDYKTALSIRLHGLKQIFVNRYVWRTQWRRRWFLWGKYRKVKVKEYIATRALFPMEYIKAVRQKARWITGISIQEWQQTGLVGNLATKYTLLHDRKAVFTHLTNMLGYVLFFFLTLYYFLFRDNPAYPSLQEQFNLHPWVWYLILLVTGLMLQRLLQRFIAIVRIYGWFPALLAVPRVVYGNLINLHALLRAYRNYFFSTPTQRKAPAWDKTEHHFPGSHVLIPQKLRLGDILLKNKDLSEADLEAAIRRQQVTGEQLGDLLVQQALVTQKQLMNVLAIQYNLMLLEPGFRILNLPELPGMSWYNYLWLKYYRSYPTAFDKATNSITIAIADPSNERLIRQIISHCTPYTVRFVLYNPMELPRK